MNNLLKLDSISNLNILEDNSIVSISKNFENSINFDVKSYVEYKNLKLRELELEYTLNLNENEYEKAILSLKKLIFFDSYNSKYYLNLAKCYIKLQDISSAISCYKKASMIEDKNSKIKNKLEKVLFAKGLISLKEGCVDTDFLNQIKEDVGKTHYYYLKAVSYLSIGKKQMAHKELEKIISLDKNHIEAHLLLGKLHLEDGKFYQSSSHLWEVHRINPNYSEIAEYVSIMKKKMQKCLEKANQNIMKGKIKMGLLWSIKALRFYPNHPEALLTRSAIYRNTREFNLCLSDLNLALANKCIDNFTEKVYKQISITYNEVGVHLLNNKNYIEANKFISESIKYNKNNLLAHFNRGECFLNLKQIDRALDEYLTCLRIDSNSFEAKARCAQVYYKYAVIAFNNKEYEEAIKYLQQGLSHHEPSAHLYILMGRCNFKLHRKVKVVENIKRALMIDPNSKDGLELIKMIKYQT